MTKLEPKEHIITTPTGRRVLTTIDNRFAHVRTPFGPAVQEPNERLMLDRHHDNLRTSADGVWIGPHHTWAITVGLACREHDEQRVTVDQIGHALLWPGAGDLRAMIDG